MNTTTPIQRAYTLAKANRDTIEALAADIEREYIKAHGIVNPDGSTPDKSWQIEDEDVFDCMMTDMESNPDYPTDNGYSDLKAAEDALIRWALSIMPAAFAKERETLNNHAFGLSGCYVHIDIRQKLIDSALRLDIRAVHA